MTVPMYKYRAARMLSSQWKLLKKSNVGQNGLPEIIKRTMKYQPKPQTTACDRALQHFDEFYKSVFRANWPSVRLGLLTKPKKVAVLNNFVDVAEVGQSLKNAGALNLNSYLEIQKAHMKSESRSSFRRPDKGTDLDKTMEMKFQEVEDFESNLFYPPNKGVEVKAKFTADSQSGSEDHLKKEEPEYDIEDATTSMDSDLDSAVIDKSRMILPGAGESDGSLHEYVPATKLRTPTQYVSESEYYKYYKAKVPVSVQTEVETEFTFPTNLNVYTFDRADLSEFTDPKRVSSHLYNYLLMDGADLLPIFALDLTPGDTVLDMCPNSGTNTYCILQTFIPKRLTCVKNKNKQVEKLLGKYLIDYSPNWKNFLNLRDLDFDNPRCENSYDKVLLDVTCTDDRLSLQEPDENIFSIAKIRDRLALPSVQCSLLLKALKFVRPGGTVVYATRTLSPVQNDGVVGEAIKLALAETENSFQIKDMTPALEHSKILFQFARSLQLKYGTMVVPFLPSNFGPRYFSKIKKLPV